MEGPGQGGLWDLLKDIKWVRSQEKLYPFCAIKPWTWRGREMLPVFWKVLLFAIFPLSQLSVPQTAHQCQCSPSTKGLCTPELSTDTEQAHPQVSLRIALWITSQFNWAQRPLPPAPIWWTGLQTDAVSLANNPALSGAIPDTFLPVENTPLI